MVERHILVIDDERDLADALADLIQLRGHTVHVAYSGRAALQTVEMQPISLALVDYALPDCNGVELIAEIRRTRPQVQVFLMSGYSVPSIVREGGEPLDIRILTKPIDVGQVLAMIQ